MAVGDAHVFPGFLTPALTQLFFPKPPTTFLTCFCRGERRKYAGKKVRLNGNQTHNHQVMSPTSSPLSHPGGARLFCRMVGKYRPCTQVLYVTKGATGAQRIQLMNLTNNLIVTLREKDKMLLNFTLSFSPLSFC